MNSVSQIVLLHRLEQSVSNPNLEELYRNRTYQLVFRKMLDMRTELENTSKDIKAQSKDRLSASDRLALLDYLLDLPLEIIEGDNK